jgi:hypothetical protein
MMKKSRIFNDILDECLERILVDGESVEQCIQSYPQFAGELRQLLETAFVTSKASAVEPRPEFRDRARHEFYTALSEMEPVKARSVFNWQPRWAIAVTAIVLVVLLAGTGTVFAASSSMPDDFLYPVKLATEQVQLLMTTSELGKAELNAKLADERVEEIVTMANESKSDEMEVAAQRLDTHLNAIADLAVSREWATSQDAMKPTFEKMVAPEAEEVAEEPEVGEVVTEEPVAPPVIIVEPITDEGGSALRVTSEIETSDGDVINWSRLRVIIENYSIKNSSRLRALLEIVPESARPALLRAIAISEIGYENAINSID